MLSDAERKFLDYAADELVRGLAEGRPIAIVLIPDPRISVHDAFAIMATAVDEPSIIRAGLTLVRGVEEDAFSDGAPIDWDKD